LAKAQEQIVPCFRGDRSGHRHREISEITQNNRCSLAVTAAHNRKSEFLIACNSTATGIPRSRRTFLGCHRGFAGEIRRFSARTAGPKISIGLRSISTGRESIWASFDWMTKLSPTSSPYCNRN
jgi:hypothetical protein